MKLSKVGKCAALVLGGTLLAGAIFLLVNINNLRNSNEVMAVVTATDITITAGAASSASCSEGISAVADATGNTPSVTEGAGTVTFSTLTLTAAIVQAAADVPTWNTSYYIDYVSAATTAELQTSLQDSLVAVGGTITLIGDLDSLATPVTAGDVKSSTVSVTQAIIDTDTTPGALGNKFSTGSLSSSTRYLEFALTVNLAAAAAIGSAVFGVSCTAP